MKDVFYYNSVELKSIKSLIEKFSFSFSYKKMIPVTIVNMENSLCYYDNEESLYFWISGMDIKEASYVLGNLYEKYRNSKLTFKKIGYGNQTFSKRVTEFSHGACVTTNNVHFMASVRDCDKIIYDHLSYIKHESTNSTITGIESIIANSIGFNRLHAHATRNNPHILFGNSVQDSFPMDLDYKSVITVKEIRKVNEFDIEIAIQVADDYSILDVLLPISKLIGYVQPISPISFIDGVLRMIVNHQSIIYFESKYFWDKVMKVKDHPNSCTVMDSITIASFLIKLHLTELDTYIKSFREDVVMSVGRKILYVNDELFDVKLKQYADSCMVNLDGKVLVIMHYEGAVGMEPTTTVIRVVAKIGTDPDLLAMYIAKLMYDFSISECQISTNECGLVLSTPNYFNLPQYYLKLKSVDLRENASDCKFIIENEWTGWEYFDTTDDIISIFDGKFDMIDSLNQDVTDVYSNLTDDDKRLRMEEDSRLFPVTYAVTPIVSNKSDDTVEKIMRVFDDEFGMVVDTREMYSEYLKENCGDETWKEDMVDKEKKEDGIQFVSKENFKVMVNEFKGRSIADEKHGILIVNEEECSSICIYVRGDIDVALVTLIVSKLLLVSSVNKITFSDCGGLVLKVNKIPLFKEVRAYLDESTYVRFNGQHSTLPEWCGGKFYNLINSAIDGLYKGNVDKISVLEDYIKLMPGFKETTTVDTSTQKQEDKEMGQHGLLVTPKMLKEISNNANITMGDICVTPPSSFSQKGLFATVPPVPMGGQYNLKIFASFEVDVNLLAKFVARIIAVSPPICVKVGRGDKSLDLRYSVYPDLDLSIIYKECLTVEPLTNRGLDVNELQSIITPFMELIFNGDVSNEVFSKLNDVLHNYKAVMGAMNSRLFGDNIANTVDHPNYVGENKASGRYPLNSFSPIHYRDDAYRHNMNHFHQPQSMHTMFDTSPLTANYDEKVTPMSTNQTQVQTYHRQPIISTNDEFETMTQQSSSDARSVEALSMLEEMHEFKHIKLFYCKDSGMQIHMNPNGVSVATLFLALLTIEISEIKISHISEGSLGLLIHVNGRAPVVNDVRLVLADLKKMLKDLMSDSLQNQRINMVMEAIDSRFFGSSKDNCYLNALASITNM